MREIGKAVLQYNHCTCDTAQALGAQARALGAGARHGALRRRRARRRRALGERVRMHNVQRRTHGAAAWQPRAATRPGGPATTRPSVRGLGAACASWLGQIGCLVHLTHFDSVFGLSTVPESLIGHCS